VVVVVPSDVVVIASHLIQFVTVPTHQIQGDVHAKQCVPFGLIV
jgi:hypothetical protein